jgi:hypothetical protein
MILHYTAFLGGKRWENEFLHIINAQIIDTVLTQRSKYLETGRIL